MSKTLFKVGDVVEFLPGDRGYRDDQIWIRWNGVPVQKFYVVSDAGNGGTVYLSLDPEGVSGYITAYPKRLRLIKLRVESLDELL